MLVGSGRVARAGKDYVMIQGDCYVHIETGDHVMFHHELKEQVDQAHTYVFARVDALTLPLKFQGICLSMDQVEPYEPEKHGEWTGPVWEGDTNTHDLDALADTADQIEAEAKDRTKEILGMLDHYDGDLNFEDKTFTIILDALRRKVSDATNQERQRVIQQCSKETNEVEQVLGRELGYPWFKDDPANFPEATEKDGVCVGEHTAVTIAMEAVTTLSALKFDLALLGKRVLEYVENPTAGALWNLKEMARKAQE
jgi:hypothetical protein